jgi:hypothetical protein
VVAHPLPKAPNSRSNSFFDHKIVKLMTQLDNNKLTQSVEELRQFSINLSRSIPLVRWVGYGLLILTLFDLVQVFVPPGFMNPFWEFQTMGALVERVPVPLLGLALVFLGQAHRRGNWERRILTFLSWLSLLFGILFLLMIPLGVVNTMRINTANTAQISAEYTQQMSRAEQVKQQLNKASTEDIDSFLKSQGRSLDGKQPEEFKDQLLSQLTQTKQQMQTQYQAKRSNQRISLFKNSVKWNLGALVSGILFIYVWRLTRWTWRQQ